MVEINTVFDSKSLHKNWQNFTQIIFDEIKKLKLERESLDVQILKTETILKVINKSKTDPSFMIKHKKVFIELDETLTPIFAALEQFEILNAMDNSVVPVLQGQILSKVDVEALKSSYEEFNFKKLELTRRISDYEDLRTGRSYSRKLIDEISSKRNLDRTTLRMILVYTANKIGKSKPKSQVKKVSREKNSDTVNTNILVEEQDQEVEVLDDDMIEDDAIAIGIQEESDIRDEYKKLVKECKQASDRYRYIINRYSSFMVNVSDEDLTNFEKYCKEIETNYDNLESHEFFDEYKHKKAMLLVSSIMNIKNDIMSFLAMSYENVTKSDIDNMINTLSKFEETSKQLIELDARVKNEKQEDKDNKKNIEYFDKQKERYNNLIKKYNDLIKKYFLIVSNMGPIEKSYINSFISNPDEVIGDMDTGDFLLREEDIEAKIVALRLFEKKEDIENSFKLAVEDNYSDSVYIKYAEDLIDELEELSIELQTMDSKTNNPVVSPTSNSDQNINFLIDSECNLIGVDDDVFEYLVDIPVDSFIRKNTVRSIENVGDYISRKVYIKRSSDNVVSFVITRSQDGKDGLLILAATSIKNEGVIRIKEETLRILKRFSNLIEVQIKLIEENNKDYNAAQESLKKARLTTVSNVLGGSNNE